MLKARKWPNFPTPPLFETPARGNTLECRDEIWLQKTRIVGLPEDEEIMTLAFFVLTQYWRMTDGQTDRHVALAKTRASIYSVARVKIQEDAVTYSPFCMDLSRTRQYLKSGLTSGSSCQQSCMQLLTDSSHLNAVSSGRYGVRLMSPPNFTFSTISVKTYLNIHIVITCKGCRVVNCLHGP